MKPGRIRPIAIAAIEHEGRLLVAQGYDPMKDETFYRPLGGTIEFGEMSHDTVVRELREELNAGLVDVRYLGCVENVFTYRGRQEHEIVLIHAARLMDPALLNANRLFGREGGSTFPVVWMPLADFIAGRAILYPIGLLDLLKPS